MQSEYQAFLERKAHMGAASGFEPLWLPDFLFDFQQFLTEWAVRQGRGAIFSDCGSGKSPMQLVWAENVIRKTNRPVLILTPLAVSAQTIEEAAKFGIEARISKNGIITDKLIITNYERLHYFNPADFAGVVCDESSILKSFDGARRTEITNFLRKVEYRLLCTATAAPNDYIELGTSSEALGYLGHIDMLTRFFKNDQGTVKTWTGGSKWSNGSKWRFKGHAEEHFWRWIASWARAIRRPSDLGFDDGAFKLPDLIEREHLVKTRQLAPGFLFAMPATGLQDEREEQRRTINERCEKVAELVNTKTPAIVWCHLNNEGNLLQELIPESIQVKGSDSAEFKEEALSGFAKGQFRVLVTKPKIASFGLNYQHCSHMTFFPSHSYEQYYQAVRRCWRFGQTEQVRVDIVTTESGHDIMENLQRKAAQADRMFTRLVAHMTDAMNLSRQTIFDAPTELPIWL